MRTATASERLTLEEEYENQESWRASADKLTFILCQPLGEMRSDEARQAVVSGVDDAPDRMVGDINFFLTPWEEDEDEDEDSPAQKPPRPLFSGEVDVMIAPLELRRQGFGRAAVTAFLHYILERQRANILAEAASAAADGSDRAALPPFLRQLVVKIQAANTASIGLFTSLGFRQRGDVNYFGEVELVRSDLAITAPDGYAEMAYERRG